MITRNDTICNIAILVNPLSGHSHAAAISRQLHQLLQARQIPHGIFIRNWPVVLDAFSDIWIIGGDGTLNYFINHYPDTRQPLSIFKGGTGNDFAWKLYGNAGVEEQVEIILQSPPRKVDAICCNDKLYINSMGIGFDGEIIHAIRTIRRLGGYTGYLLAVIRNIFRFREKLYNISWGNEKLEGKFLLLNINNSTRTGGGFLISPHAKIDDGKADLVICDPLSVPKRLRYLPVMQKGRHLSLPFIHYQQLPELAIITPTSVYAHADGELLEGNSFVFRVLPAQFSFRYR